MDRDVPASDKLKDLDRYMGKVGAISAKGGTAKVASDYNDDDLVLEEYVDNGGALSIVNGNISMVVVTDTNDNESRWSRGRGRRRGRG